MVIMRIHCGACGGQWEVYGKQRSTTAARICPHCEHRIDGNTWTERIMPAYQAVGAANMALANDHIDKHIAEYSIDFITDGQFQNAQYYQLEYAIQELKDYLERGRMNAGRMDG